MTAVHPAARAAPSFRVIIAEGKFHGVRMELYVKTVVSMMSNSPQDDTTHTTPKIILIVN